MPLIPCAFQCLAECVRARARLCVCVSECNAACVASDVGRGAVERIEHVWTESESKRERRRSLRRILYSVFCILYSPMCTCAHAGLDPPFHCRRHPLSTPHHPAPTPLTHSPTHLPPPDHFCLTRPSAHSRESGNATYLQDEAVVNQVRDRLHVAIDNWKASNDPPQKKYIYIYC